MVSTNSLVNSFKKMERQSQELRVPIATEMYLPNHSGDHSAGRVLREPVNDHDIPNKSYVDGISVPIGGIIPFTNHITGTPALSDNWQICDGDTVEDPDSPLYGQTLPNLNSGARFVRGNAVSGSTGGSTSHTHTLSVISATISANSSFDVMTAGAVNVAKSNHNHTISGTTESSTFMPPYYNVIWIMRIK